MSSICHRNKGHQRADYIRCNEICIICEALKTHRSKIFNSSYALKYHLTTEHSREDEIISGISKEEVLSIAKAIAVALEWDMLIDLPKRSD
jgi:hypothetical protein